MHRSLARCWAGCGLAQREASSCSASRPSTPTAASPSSPTRCSKISVGAHGYLRRGPPDALGGRSRLPALVQPIGGGARGVGPTPVGEDRSRHLGTCRDGVADAARALDSTTPAHSHVPVLMQQGLELHWTRIMARSEADSVDEGLRAAGLALHRGSSSPLVRYSSDQRNFCSFARPACDV